MKVTDSTIISKVFAFITTVWKVSCSCW